MDGVKENGFLKVREVCELLGISPHTLRYWEKEFSEYLRPLRSPGGHRLYDDHNLRKLLEIKYLLKDKLYSIKGVKIIMKGKEDKKFGTNRKRLNKKITGEKNERKNKAL